MQIYKTEKQNLIKKSFYELAKKKITCQPFKNCLQTIIRFQL